LERITHSRIKKYSDLKGGRCVHQPSNLRRRTNSKNQTISPELFARDSKLKLLDLSQEKRLEMIEKQRESLMDD